MYRGFPSVRRTSSRDIPMWSLERVSSFKTWWTSRTARSAPTVTMKVWTPRGPCGYSHPSEPSGFSQTLVGAPTSFSTCWPEAPGAMAEKLAHPAANRAGSNRRRARKNVEFMVPPNHLAVVVHPEDFLEALGGPDRARGPVEEHVEEHGILLLIAPGPHLFVAALEHRDLPGPAEQPPHFVAGHARLHLRKIFLAQHLVGFPHRAIRSQSHHVRLPSERAPGIFPDLRAVGVLPDRFRRAQLRLDLLCGHPARDGGEIRASGKGPREREEKKAEGGFWHEFDPMRYDHRLDRRLDVNIAMLAPIPRFSVPHTS